MIFSIAYLVISVVFVYPTVHLLVGAMGSDPPDGLDWFMGSFLGTFLSIFWLPVLLMLTANLISCRVWTGIWTPPWWGRLKTKTGIR